MNSDLFADPPHFSLTENAKYLYKSTLLSFKIIHEAIRYEPSDIDFCSSSITLSFLGIHNFIEKVNIRKLPEAFISSVAQLQFIHHTCTCTHIENVDHIAFSSYTSALSAATHQGVTRELLATCTSAKPSTLGVRFTISLCISYCSAR